MSILKKANLIIYRVREKGLEVFLVNPKQEEEQWTIPQCTIQEETKAIALVKAERAIALDPVQNMEGEAEDALAVEGDWHDIPSLKGLIKSDASFVKDTLEEMIPNMQQEGTYFAIKEAFKKVLPNQYGFLKELKEIIRERNSTTFM